jgi:site-specific DNA-adenine methylase
MRPNRTVRTTAEPTRVDDILTRAHAVLDIPESISKTIWGSPAGKKRLAKRLAALLPSHTTYVEPFAGSAAVFFAKDPVEVEVLNDADSEIVEAFRILKRLKPDQLQRLRRMKWVGDEATFKKLVKAHPKNDVEKLHRFLYLSHFSYGKLRGKSFSPSAKGAESLTVDRIEKFAPRLRRARIHCGDYERVVRKYDSSKTTFYLDPPYPGYNVEVGEGEFDEERFLKVLKSIKGNFLVTYGVRGELPKRFEKEGFTVKRIRPSRTIRSMHGVGGSKVLTTLLVSNYDPVEKGLQAALGPDWELEEEDLDKAAWSRAYINDLDDDSFLYIESGGKKDESGKTVPRTLRHFPVRDADGNLDLPHLRNAIARIPQSKIPGLTDKDLSALQDKARRLVAEAEGGKPSSTGKVDDSTHFTKSVTLIKGADPSDERYVLGIVLEPETVDAQEDIYSADEVRQAAHRFMEEFGGIGLMHQVRVNDQVKVLESYLAPVDFAIGEIQVRKGTWLLAVHVLSDDLWAQVKGGQLTGFSIGGTARSIPTPGGAS